MPIACKAPNTHRTAAVRNAQKGAAPMAKPNPSPSNRSKVRIFFVDADLAPGDMHELTSALTTAIRPTHVLTRVGATPRLTPAEDDGNGAREAHADVDEQADVI